MKADAQPKDAFFYLIMLCGIDLGMTNIFGGHYIFTLITSLDVT